MSTAQKQCEACGKSFGCPDGVRRHVWQARKYCSQPCSSKARRMKSDEWRATVTKVCWVCNQVFRPLPGVRWQAWIRKDICDRFCGAAACHGQRVVVSDPIDQIEPYQRLRWLRLSASKCGKKVPWSILHMSMACAMSGKALYRIEKGDASGKAWIPAAAAKLGVDPRLFTIPVERFAKVVTDAGLSAKLSVPREEGRAA